MTVIIVYKWEIFAIYNQFSKFVYYKGVVYMEFTALIFSAWKQIDALVVSIQFTAIRID